jgi:spore maturation protein CgeB
VTDNCSNVAASAFHPSYRILYLAPLVPEENALFRFWALQRLGHALFAVDETYFKVGGSRLAQAARFRTQMGPTVAHYNATVLDQAIRHGVDIVWADKEILLHPETLRALRRRGIATVDFTIDNAYGPRNDPGWQTYKSCVGEYDLHVLQRDVSLRDYLAAGARNVVKMQTAFDLALSYPPPFGWNDRDRDREVSFVGSPYDDRADFLSRLHTEFALPVIISGTPRWAEVLAAGDKHLYSGSEMMDAEYRRALWRSKINLSFVTKANQDEYAHKTFEIAGCAGFQIAERCPGHQERFVEDEEIVLFSTLEECAAKIRRYLPDEAARQRIAWAGYRRALRSGYYNDALLTTVLAKLDAIVSAVRADVSPTK